MPIFCFDPRFFTQIIKNRGSTRKCGLNRTKFILESVLSLRSKLEQLNNGLIIAFGKPEDVIT